MANERMTSLQNKKVVAKENYKSAKVNYFENHTNENWIAFCDAKRECMLLGVSI